MEVKLTDGNIIKGELETFDVNGIRLKNAKLEDYTKNQTLTLGKKVFVPFGNILYIVEQL